MAIIYTKSTTAGPQNCVILDYRQSMYYPFKLKDWNHARFALVVSYTAATENSDLNNFGTQSITANQDKDRIFFGVKRYSQNYPGAESGEYFCGFKTFGAYSSISFPDVFFGGKNVHGESCTIGVSHSDGSHQGHDFDLSDLNSFVLCAPDEFDNTSTYSALLCFDMEIVNKGQSNQQVKFKWAKQSMTDISQISVENAINGATYNDLGTLDFNFNGVPYDLPDSFFAYLPLGAVRLRVFGLDAIYIS